MYLPFRDDKIICLSPSFWTSVLSDLITDGSALRHGLIETPHRIENLRVSSNLQIQTVLVYT